MIWTNTKMYPLWRFLSCIWWRHQMEAFYALLPICAGNSPMTGEFPAQSPVTRTFEAFFHLRLNTRLSEEWWGWWFETPSRPLWRHCDEVWSTSCREFYSVRPHKRPLSISLFCHLSLSGCHCNIKKKQLMRYIAKYFLYNEWKISSIIYSALKSNAMCSNKNDVITWWNT